jgi:hypothetical protein
LRSGGLIASHYGWRVVAAPIVVRTTLSLPLAIRPAVMNGGLGGVVFLLPQERKWRLPGLGRNLREASLKGGQG